MALIVQILVSRVKAIWAAFYAVFTFFFYIVILLLAIKIFCFAGGIVIAIICFDRTVTPGIALYPH